MRLRLVCVAALLLASLASNLSGGADSIKGWYVLATDPNPPQPYICAYKGIELLDDPTIVRVKRLKNDCKANVSIKMDGFQPTKYVPVPDPDPDKLARMNNLLFINVELGYELRYLLLRTADGRLYLEPHP